jgi:hypothetical protein
MGVLRDVVEASLRRRHSFGPEADLSNALGIIRQLFEQVERAGLRGLETAQAGPSD